MRMKVTHTVGDLAADLRYIARTAHGDMVGVVREGIRVGNTVAKDYARVSAGTHGKHYHKAFSSEITSRSTIIIGEYGPNEAMPQGGMSFEGGSRNQPPHNDLAKSADLIGPAFQGEVSRLSDNWFWPER